MPNLNRWLVSVVACLALQAWPAAGALEAQTVSFVARRDVLVGLAPEAVAAGDFNNDGLADLVTVNSQSNNVSVALNNGNGTFQPALNFPVGRGPSAVAVGDFNGDGAADLAVTNSADNNVSVLLGNGDGTFRTAVKPKRKFRYSSNGVTCL